MTSRKMSVRVAPSATRIPNLVRPPGDTVRDHGEETGRGEHDSYEREQGHRADAERDRQGRRQRKSGIAVKQAKAEPHVLREPIGASLQATYRASV
jgi:hypothetical protein